MWGGGEDFREVSSSLSIRDDVKVDQLVRARDCQSRGRRVDSGKNSKTKNSNLHGFEVHRPSSKGTKLLFQIIKAIINQSGKNIPPTPCESLRGGHCNVLLTPMRGGTNRRCYEFSSYNAGGL